MPHPFRALTLREAGDRPGAGRHAVTPTSTPTVAREVARDFAPAGSGASLGHLARAARAHGALGALVATAAADLWRYQAGARWRGPSLPHAVAVLGRWSRRAWRWLGVDVQVHGAPPATPAMYVANHRSYLDIPLLSGVLEASFMSRADVATWPIVGPAAAAVGSVFVERDDPRGRVRAARALARRLGTVSVVVFPEGTTGGERLPGAFHLGLFRLLHRLEVRVVPVTIRYGERRAYWTDEIGLGEHLRHRVLASPLAAAVHLGGALDPVAFADGDALARAAHAAVCRPIEELGELVRGTVSAR
jgi:1-acyl-sn-glycerol-3-phosphate acyltransferase